MGICLTPSSLPADGGSLRVAVRTGVRRCVASAALTGVYTDGSVVFACGVDQRLTVWRVVDSDETSPPSVQFVSSDAVDVADVSGMSVVPRGDRYVCRVPLPSPCPQRPFGSVWSVCVCALSGCVDASGVGPWPSVAVRCKCLTLYYRETCRCASPGTHESVSQHIYCRNRHSNT